MIEYIVIAGYLAFLIAMGLVFRSFNSNVSDYFRSGCKGTWWLVGASAFMGAFSAWTFTGAAGSAFESGWSILIIFLGNVVAFGVHALLLAPWFRQLRAVTAPEVIRKRFGPGTQQVYAWLYAVLGMLQAAVWLWSLAVFISTVFDWTDLASSLGMGEVQFVIAVVGIVVLTYSVSGGSWAVMATDVIQSIVLFPLTILVAFLCLREIGGVSELFQRIDDADLTHHFALISPPGEIQPQEDHPDFWKYTMIFAWATIIYKVVTFSTIDVAQKYFGVKDGREARKAALLAGGLMVFGMCFWFIPPIVARLLWSDDVMAMQLSKPAEGAYAVAGLKVLPAGMVGLMIVSMLSATMSSMDSGLNKNAAVFTRDIIPFFHRITGKSEFSDKASFIIGQITSTILGITIIGIALYFDHKSSKGNGGKGVFEMMLDIGAMLSLPMAVPLALGLFIRRVPTWSAAVSVTAGVIPSVIAYIAARESRVFSESFVDALPGFLAPLFDGGWPYHLKVFINLSVGAAAFLLTMPFWPKVTQATRQRTTDFFETMHKPVDFAAEVGEANDTKQLAVIGGFTAAVGGGIALLLLIPSHTWGDRLSVLFVSAAVSLTGCGLIWAGKRS